MIKESSFIKCGSPLGEFELHVDANDKQLILEAVSNHKSNLEYIKMVEDLADRYRHTIADLQYQAKRAQDDLAVWIQTFGDFTRLGTIKLTKALKVLELVEKDVDAADHSVQSGINDDNYHRLSGAADFIEKLKEIVSQNA